MTAKNRQRSSSAAAGPEDAKKGQRSNGSGTQGPPSRSCLGLIATTVFYVGMLGAAGVAAFYLHQVMEEIRETSSRHEESAHRSAELSSQIHSALQQVDSLRTAVNGLESSLGVTRLELEGAVSRLQTGEVETRRVEEALQNLQNDLLRDLSEGIKEVKEARERDFSSLEKTVEERLSEVSQSITTNIAEFTEAQGQAQSQLADLKARLGDVEDPGLLKQELSVIVETVAEIKTAKDAADTWTNSLREQIGSVRQELQTRNQEVASLSQEVQSVRSLVQDTVGNLRQSLSGAVAEVQSMKDKTLTLESGVAQAAEAVLSVERQVSEVAARAQRRSEDLEARVKASEESGDALSTSLSDTTTKVESLLAKYDNHESTLAAQGQAAEKARAGLEQELGTVRSLLEELQSNTASLGGAQAQLALKDSGLDQQVEDLRRRLATLEEGGSGGSTKPEQLESLRNMVAGLEKKAAKLEGHDQAIASLQKALQETTQTLEGLSRPSEKAQN